MRNLDPHQTSGPYVSLSTPAGLRIDRCQPFAGSRLHQALVRRHEGHPFVRGRLQPESRGEVDGVEHAQAVTMDQTSGRAQNLDAQLDLDQRQPIPLKALAREPVLELREDSFPGAVASWRNTAPRTRWWPMRSDRPLSTGSEPHPILPRTRSASPGHWFPDRSPAILKDRPGHRGSGDAQRPSSPESLPGRQGDHPESGEPSEACFQRCRSIQVLEGLQDCHGTAPLGDDDLFPFRGPSQVVGQPVLQLPNAHRANGGTSFVAIVATTVSRI
jgi:hypothetical protein